MIRVLGLMISLSFKCLMTLLFAIVLLMDFNGIVAIRETLTLGVIVFLCWRKPVQKHFEYKKVYRDNKRYREAAKKAYAEKRFEKMYNTYGAEAPKYVGK